MNHGIEFLQRQIGGDTLPRSHTLFKRLHHAVDSQQVDSAITSESKSATPAGCLCAKITGSQDRLDPVSREHVQRLREQTVAAHSNWLERSVARGEIVLPVSLEIAAT